MRQCGQVWPQTVRNSQEYPRSQSYTCRAPCLGAFLPIQQDVETLQQLVERPDYQRPYALRHHNGRSLPRNDPGGRLVEERPQQHGYAWYTRAVLVRSFIGMASLSADTVFIASPSNLSVLSLKNSMNTAPRQFIPSTLLTYLKSP
jgi:hypothetical protein